MISHTGVLYAMCEALQTLLMSDIGNIMLYSVIYMKLHSSEGKGDRGKRTSDRARTWDLHTIAEFQPCEPRRPVEILLPASLLCTGSYIHAIFTISMLYSLYKYINACILSK